MKTLTGILVSLLSLYGVAKSQDSTVVETPAFSGSAFVKVATGYVALPGMVVTEEPSAQSNISLTFSPFDGKYGSITGFKWDSRTKKQEQEVDFGVAYEFKPSANSGKILSKLKASLGWVNWMFTDGINDDVVEGIVSYSGPVDATMILDKLPARSDFATNLIVTKIIPVTSISDKLTFTPEARASYVNSFYGHTGWTQGTLAGTLNYAFNDNVSVSLEGYAQKDLLYNDQDQVKDITSAKVGINAKF